MPMISSGQFGMNTNRKPAPMPTPSLKSNFPGMRPAPMPTMPAGGGFKPSGKKPVQMPTKILGGR